MLLLLTCLVNGHVEGTSAKSYEGAPEGISLQTGLNLVMNPRLVLGTGGQ